MATAKPEPTAEDLNDLNQRIADEAAKAQTTAPPDPPKSTSKD